jgi:hypothetical protein
MSYAPENNHFSKIGDVSAAGAERSRAAMRARQPRGRLPSRMGAFAYWNWNSVPCPLVPPAEVVP